MNEDKDARLAKAAMKSLLVPAPDGLKAELKRMARARKAAPSFWDGLRERFSFGEAWAYGAGAAFAAAGLGIVILRPVPPRASEPERPAQALETAAPQTLQDLWTDDDGEDHDEL